MEKKFGKNFQPLQVDQINGDYYIIIPEWIANELSWYEDTEIELKVESNELILREKEDE
jgi:antitoxin component of MazEF toxin-antitoxin module